MPRTKASKVRTHRRAAGMEVVAEQERTKRAKHTAWIAQLKGDLHELKSKLNVLERRNNVAFLRYFMLGNECNSPKCQCASAGMCNGEMVR